MDNYNITSAEPLAEQNNQKKGVGISIKISVKAAVIIAAIIVLAALAFAYKGLFVAATVGSSPISRLAVIQKLEKSLGKSVLDSLVVEKLIQQEAKAKKIVVSGDEINEEIKKIEEQMTQQGFTLKDELSAQGMTMNDFKKQILLQKQVEKLLTDKIKVTDEEAAQYIKDNSIPMPKGQEATTTSQIKDDLQNQKLSLESSALIKDLRAKAKIRYFVNY